MAKKSWPYPVLDPDGEDYPNRGFQASVELKQTPTKFVGKVRIDMGSTTLQKAVKDGDAVFAVQLHCPRTSHRQIIKSSSADFTFELPEGLLRDEFTTQPFVVADRDWTLGSSEFAPTFNGMTFPVQRGYVLAVAPPIYFTAEKRLDDLKSVKAIFHVIQHSDNIRKAIEFDFEADRIGIVLSVDDYKRYGLVRATPPYSQLFVCSLVLPALHQALVLLKEDETSDEVGPRWKRVLRRCLKDCGEENYDKERAFEVAQKLLEMPFNRAMTAVIAHASED